MTLLATWLWQGVLVAAATIAVLHFATRLNAASRYALSWAGFAPFSCYRSPPLASLASSDDLPLSAIDGPAGRAAAPLVVGLPDWLVSVAVGVWMGTVIVAALRLALSLQNNRSSSGGIAPHACRTSGGLRHWARCLPSGRRAELRVSSELTGACAIGLRRPMVVVSERCVRRSPTTTSIESSSMSMRTWCDSMTGRPCARPPSKRSPVSIPRFDGCAGRSISNAKPHATIASSIDGRRTSVRRVPHDCGRVRPISRLDDALMPSGAASTRSTLHARVVRLLDSPRRRGHNVEHRLAGRRPVCWHSSSSWRARCHRSWCSSKPKPAWDRRGRSFQTCALRVESRHRIRNREADRHPGRKSVGGSGHLVFGRRRRSFRRRERHVLRRLPTSPHACRARKRLAPAPAVASQPSATLRTTNSGLHATMVHNAPAMRVEADAAHRRRY